MASSPRCGPSRTGLWPARNGAEPNHVPKGTEVAGLPSVLHALGYEVAAIGKLAHNGWEKIHCKFDHTWRAREIGRAHV